MASLPTIPAKVVAGVGTSAPGLPSKRSTVVYHNHTDRPLVIIERTGLPIIIPPIYCNHNRGCLLIERTTAYSHTARPLFHVISGKASEDKTPIDHAVEGGIIGQQSMGSNVPGSVAITYSVSSSDIQRDIPCYVELADIVVTTEDMIGVARHPSQGCGEVEPAKAKVGTVELPGVPAGNTVFLSSDKIILTAETVQSTSGRIVIHGYDSPAIRSPEDLIISNSYTDAVAATKERSLDPKTKHELEMSRAKHMQAIKHTDDTFRMSTLHNQQRHDMHVDQERDKHDLKMNTLLAELSVTKEIANLKAAMATFNDGGKIVRAIKDMLK